jgi:hypothetical protein
VGSNRHAGGGRGECLSFLNLKNLVDKVVVDEKQHESKTWLTTWLLQSYPQDIHSQEKVIHRISTELSTMKNR